VGTFKNNQKGFSLIETLAVVTIVLLTSAVGWLVYRDSKTSPLHVGSTQSQSSSGNTTQASGPNPKQYSGWQSFCSSYGGFCFKYPPNWKLSQVINTPGQSPNGQEVDTFTSPSTNVTVIYMPSAQVTGSRRSESIKVVGVSSTAIRGIEVVQLLDHINNQAANYAVEDFVTLTSAAHALNASASPFTPGTSISSTSDPPYHQFTNSIRPSDIGQQLIVVAENGGNAASNIFNNTSDAQAWLNSSEVQTAGQILDSVTYSQ
jgi:prepilin-type N-terminal cleavage/methylation domain-containing protein